MVLQAYLDSLKPATRASYGISIRQFLQVGMERTFSDSVDLDFAMDEYLESRQMKDDSGRPLMGNDKLPLFNEDWIGEDLVKFGQWLEKERYAPKSFHAKLSGISAFLSDHQIEISRKKKKLALKPYRGLNEASVQDKLPSRRQMQNLLAFMDLRGRAFLTLAKSCGRRPAELMKLRMSDLDLTTDPPTILLHKENLKEGKWLPRDTWTHCDKEAKKYLQDWLHVRDAIVRPDEEGYKTDERLFPFSFNVISRQWAKAIKHCGLDEIDEHTKQRRQKYHVYSATRKYFSTYAHQGELDNETKQFLMGHVAALPERGVYDMYSPAQTGKEYAKAESALYCDFLYDGWDEKVEPTVRTVDEIERDVLGVKIEAVQRAYTGASEATGSVRDKPLLSPDQTHARTVLRGSHFCGSDIFRTERRRPVPRRSPSRSLLTKTETMLSLPCQAATHSLGNV